MFIIRLWFPLHVSHLISLHLRIKLRFLKSLAEFFFHYGRPIVLFTLNSNHIIQKCSYDLTATWPFSRSHRFDQANRYRILGTRLLAKIYYFITYCLQWTLNSIPTDSQNKIRKVYLPIQLAHAWYVFCSQVMKLWQQPRLTSNSFKS